MRASTIPTIVCRDIHFGQDPAEKYVMSLILLEALGALVLLLGIVWWTMFAGRPKGELKPKEPSEHTSPESKDPSTRP